MLALIDNYDSFTYNLVQYFAELDQEVQVYRNDEVSIAELREKKPAAIVISAGPCTPDEAGISMEVTRDLAQDLPILGVCLGMQSMVQAYGGNIVAAQEIMHGKLARIFHEGDKLFAAMDNPFVATRYNSLAAETTSLPDCFEVIAKSYVGDAAVGYFESGNNPDKSSSVANLSKSSSPASPLSAANLSKSSSPASPSSAANLSKSPSPASPDSISSNDISFAGANSSDNQANSTRPYEIMGVRHKDFPMVGVQFHPESILSQQGKMIMQNFLQSL